MGTDSIKGTLLEGVSRLLVGIALVTVLVGTRPITALAESPTTEPLLVPPSKGFPPWYERLFHYTSWPQAPGPKEVGEVPEADYSYEVMVKEVLRDDVLEAGWQERFLRVPQWIPQLSGSTPCKLDAYVYRQAFRDGTLHICDTRPFLIVAFSSKSPESLLQQPEQSLAKLTALLLKVSLPQRTPLRVDDATGFAIAHARFNATSPKPSGAGAFKPQTPGASSFSLCCYLGKDIVVYEFQKLYVPGCEVNARVPLFRSALAPPTEAEKAIALFQSINAPAPSDIPKIAEALKSLPVLDPRDQRSHPHEFMVLSKAKYSGYDRLIDAVKEARSPEDVGFVTEALDALPSDPDLHAKAEGIQRAAIASLRKIGTPEAIEGLKKIADTAKTPHIFADSTEAILKAMPEDEARRIALEQVQAMAVRPDDEPDKLLFYMRALAPQEDPPQVRVVRDILRETANEEVRGECLHVLAEWVAEPAKVRDDALRILKEHVAHPIPRVRSDAARAFGGSGDVRYLTLLAPMMDDPNDGVRRTAGEAVCALLGWDRKQAENAAALKGRLAPVLEALKRLETAAWQGKAPAAPAK